VDNVTAIVTAGVNAPLELSMRSMPIEAVSWTDLEGTFDDESPPAARGHVDDARVDDEAGRRHIWYPWPDGT
jgi:hypothetical protein